MPEDKNDETREIMDLLSETTEANLESFIKGRISTRVAELRKRQEELARELAAIEQELELIARQDEGDADGAEVQDVLSRLLKKKPSA